MESFWEKAYLDSDPFLSSSQDPFIARRRPFLTSTLPPLSLGAKNGVSPCSPVQAPEILECLCCSVGGGVLAAPGTINTSTRRAMLCCCELAGPLRKWNRRCWLAAPTGNAACKTTTVQHKPTHPRTSPRPLDERKDRRARISKKSHKEAPALLGEMMKLIAMSCKQDIVLCPAFSSLPGRVVGPVEWV